jgi:hypothetical protein
MVGRICLELDMSRRTVVLFYIVSMVLQVQIWQTHLLSTSKRSLLSS